jgi:hypothetical protein
MENVKLDFYNYIKENKDESLFLISYNKKDNSLMGCVSGDFENIISLIVNEKDLPDSKLIQSIIMATASHLILTNNHYYDVLKELINNLEKQRELKND